jgi:transposase
MLVTSRKQHPAELRERAVAMVFELRAESGSARGSLASVGHKLGINPETLRNWVEKAEVDSGQRPGTTSDDRKRIAELEREVRELRRANEILKAASAYFARESNEGETAITRLPAFPQNPHTSGLAASTPTKYPRTKWHNPALVGT